MGRLHNEDLQPHICVMSLFSFVMCASFASIFGPKRVLISELLALASIYYP